MINTIMISPELFDAIRHELDVERTGYECAEDMADFLSQDLQGLSYTEERARRLRGVIAMLDQTRLESASATSPEQTAAIFDCLEMLLREYTLPTESVQAALGIIARFRRDDIKDAELYIKRLNAYMEQAGDLIGFRTEDDTDVV